MKKLTRIIYHAIFWLWNLTFLTIVYLGILPFIGIYLFIAAGTGELPWDLLAALIGLIAVPTICTILGLWRFRQQSQQLIRLFYGVEAPLFLLCLIRLFLVRESTLASLQLFGTLALTAGAFELEMLCGYLGRNPSIAPHQRQLAAGAQLICHSLMLTIGLFAGGLLLFYAMPLAAWLPLQFFSFSWLEIFQSDHWRQVLTAELPFWSVVISLIASFFLVATAQTSSRRWFTLQAIGTLGVNLGMMALLRWAVAKIAQTSDNLYSWQPNVWMQWQGPLFWSFALSLLVSFGLTIATHVKPDWKALRTAAVVILTGWAVIVLVLQGVLGWSSMWGSTALLLSLLLFGFTSALFVAMPAVMATLYSRSWFRIGRAVSEQYGRRWALAGMVAPIAVWLAIFVALQQQPQVQALALLNAAPTSDRERQALLAQSETLRAGLVNAYLASYRYLSPAQEVNHIQTLYQGVFNLPEPVAQTIQQVYNGLMSPLLYQGDRTDSEQAAKLYAEFFDQPIQRAERDAIAQAVRSTWNREEAKAGLLNINQEKVWLQRQELNVQPQGDWAEVELHEVYENQTPNLQEVFYSFSLPESAVLTGLWLSDTDKTRRYTYVVSPRGAAQKVYTAQVRENIDPALLEQVGPRQYRLRAFPIPARTRAFEQLDRQQRGEAPANPAQFHLWMSYKVMQQPSGFALPQLTEKRNVFWTGRTQRTLNGKPLDGKLLDGKLLQTQDAWLPAVVTAAAIGAPVQSPTTHSVTLTSGERITAKPLSQILSQKQSSLPQNQRFAIVLDRSRSMSAHQQDLQAAIDWLNANGFADNQLANNDADLYLTGTGAAQPQRLDDLRQFQLKDLTFYGTIQPNQMLQQFAQLRQTTRYDAVILLTDAGSYELASDQKTVPSVAAPLWMVHFGGLPAAYEDAVLKAIQDSGGSAATTVPEVMQRLATQAKLEGAESGEVLSVVDGYAWIATKAPAPRAPDRESGFAAIAARQQAMALSRRFSRESDADKLAQLDAIHALAKSIGMVTPYSSMIVLVNDQQRQELKQAEAKSDRFDRTVETGEEQLTQPNNPMVSAVPEPSEWLLIGLGAIGLSLIALRQHRLARAGEEATL
jgi:putative PEP-CTERM system integral membrane protein